MESLAQNHLFIDGKMRTAFAVTYTFLAINGWRITAESVAANSFITGLYETRAFEFGALVDGLRDDTNVNGRRPRQS